MDQIDAEVGCSEAPALGSVRLPRPNRPCFAPQFEAEIGQLYLRTQDEPVPLRLLTILRTGLGSKA